eukprot:1160740-Pelagomonas_calceolata.AAC.9
MQFVQRFFDDRIKEMGVQDKENGCAVEVLRTVQPAVPVESRPPARPLNGHAFKHSFHVYSLQPTLFLPSIHFKMSTLLSPQTSHALRPGCFSCCRAA